LFTRVARLVLPLTAFLLTPFLQDISPAGHDTRYRAVAATPRYQQPRNLRRRLEHLIIASGLIKHRLLISAPPHCTLSTSGPYLRFAATTLRLPPRTYAQQRNYATSAAATVSPLLYQMFYLRTSLASFISAHQANSGHVFALAWHAAPRNNARSTVRATTSPITLRWIYAVHITSR